MDTSNKPLPPASHHTNAGAYYIVVDGKAQRVKAQPAPQHMTIGAQFNPTTLVKRSQLAEPNSSFKLLDLHNLPRRKPSGMFTRAGSAPVPTSPRAQAPRASSLPSPVPPPLPRPQRA